MAGLLTRHPRAHTPAPRGSGVCASLSKEGADGSAWVHWSGVPGSKRTSDTHVDKTLIPAFDDLAAAESEIEGDVCLMLQREDAVPRERSGTMYLGRGSCRIGNHLDRPAFQCSAGSAHHQLWI